ncbi:MULTISPECIES: hypothetical protein [Acinetobacter]|uniref:DUF4124 domain-containing protein n=1 Tax=Acinetobacter corruptisaponis TaxID=3045147 RepID=A0ABY8S6S7_9GAMM|nr:hypothetical protein [Acinetobacter sp. KCTC 92772]WHP07395.1 hypothetical protein QLH32_08075 [Acinetobacter sp. KCTC 92772]
MKLSFAAKIAVVSLLIGVCSTQANARRLYKWVDQSSVTNYSEFKPKEGTERKLEVLESRGNDHVDPAMAVTAEMKPIEIPVDMVNPASSPVATNPNSQTVYKQGAIVEPYTRPASGVVATQPSVEKKEAVITQHQPTSPEKQGTTAIAERPASTVVATVEKVKEEPVAATVPAEKKVQIKVNPWTRTVDAVPSNLVPENLPRTSSGNPEK